VSDDGYIVGISGGARNNIKPGQNFNLTEKMSQYGDTTRMEIIRFGQLTINSWNTLSIITTSKSQVIGRNCGV
jgi:hypothetical protein